MTEITAEFGGKMPCLKESGVTTQGRKEVEVATILLGNDTNNFIANYSFIKLFIYLSKGLSNAKDK